MNKNTFIYTFLAVMISLSSIAQETWTGATSTDWSNNGNWSDGSAPGAFSGAITIQNRSNDPVMTNVNLNIFGSLNIRSGATLTVTSSSINQQGGTTDNVGTVILNSGSAFYSSATVSGSGVFTYNRNLAAANKWYVMSSPVATQSIPDFITAEPIPTSGNNNLGFGTYNTASDNYTYATAAAPITGNFTLGKGYIVRVESTGNVTFTGSNPTTGNVTFSLNFSGSTRYNLVGNPWPAHLKSADMLIANTSKLTSQTIWVWNANSGAFETKVSGAGFMIAPGQGFYVQAKSGGSGNLTFEHSDLLANSSDTFRNSIEERFEVYLNISAESVNRTAEVYYIEGTTTGFDNGYDGELFASQDNDFAIYTRSDSDENDSNLNLFVQSIPEMSHIVPVGVNALEGTEFRITSTTLNRPEGYNVYLEDRDNNTFTLLDDSSEFTTLLTESLNGIGRFYLHTSTSALNNNDANEVALKVFKADNNNFITIQGLMGQSSVTNVKLYSIIGTEVLSATLDNNINKQSISTEGLSAGIYIIKLESSNNQLTKKFIIK